MSDLPQLVLRPSLLARLVDTTAKPKQNIEIGARELRREVLRDLERLLETRSTLCDDLQHFPQARTSVLAYGLPDLTSLSQANPEHRQRIHDALVEAIRRMEPRLAPRSVEVTLLPRAADSGPTPSPRLHFRIKATLHVEPIREPVSFDTSIDLDRGTVRIEEIE